ncbi:MAG TPA: hypothetical protein VN695_19005 [Streptosporangiaceae bacterium]|nr:hypothetical protein [Streptosporangiaceae bacterium]
MILNHEAEGYTTTSRNLTAAELTKLRSHPEKLLCPSRSLRPQDQPAGACHVYALASSRRRDAAWTDDA